MDAAERAFIENLIHTHRSHLQVLEQQAATFGVMAPPYVVTQITEYRQKIAELEGRLRPTSSLSTEGPRHNLPPRDYEQFIGRQKELAEVRRLLGSKSRAFVVTVDGIGGIGKSTLVLEAAYAFVDQYNDLPATERFDAIVWVSAKRTYLTAGGIRERRQVFRTLSDVFAAIARVLDYPAITRARAEEQRAIVEQALRVQRTLLILDNLETVDDDDLLDFLNELPEPTKALVTTRHRIDVARPVRLTEMAHSDAVDLITQEAARKDVVLTLEEQEELWRRTGGVPLAIVWSIGLMGLGGSVESVLRRLGSGQSDIARFCFQESMAQIRGRDAYKLLLGLAVFDTSVNRSMLGHIAGVGADEFGRDVGLEELLRLSIVNKEGDRFSLLPLTRTFVAEEFLRQPELEHVMREGWVDHLMKLARPYGGLHWRWRDRHWLRQEGKHFVALASWAQDVMRPEVLLAVIPALSYYYDLLGQWTDLLHIGQIGIDFARLTDELETMVFIEHYIGWIFSHQGRYEEAERYTIDALNLSQKLGDPAWKCSALQSYSQVLRRRGVYDLARKTCLEAFDLLDEVSEVDRPYVRADIDYELGKVERDAGNWSPAKTHFLSARSIFRHDDDHPVFNIEFAWGLLSNLGLIAYMEGDYEQARQYYDQCLAAYRDTGGKGDIATLMIRMATLEQRQNNYGKALTLAREALEWIRKLGMVQEQAEAEALLAKLAHGSPEPTQDQKKPST